MSDTRSRQFCAILYPDNIDMMNAIDNFPFCCDNFAYIYHDKDVTDNGEIKKLHVHALLLFNNAKTVSAVSKLFNVPANYFQPCKDLKGAFRYLIHYDDSDKYQYDVYDIHCSDLFKGRIQNYLSFKEKVDDNIRFRDFLSWLNQQNYYVTSRHILYWALDNNDVSFYRRFYTIINDERNHYNYQMNFESPFERKVDE